MALFLADVPVVVNGPAYGQPLANRLTSNKLGGRIRIAEFTYTAPASGTAPAIADKIIWGKLPTKARILGHLSKLYWTTGTASCTLNLGDSMVAARHLAATAITTAGNAVPEASAITQSATATTTTGSNLLTAVTSIGAFQVGAIVTGTGIPTGTTVTSISGSGNVALSAVATATGTGVAITVNGGSYVTQDDTSTLANNYGSTTDDCTLVSVVAGAQIANNQVLTLKVAYVCD
jgi:hypothetical protein